MFNKELELRGLANETIRLYLTLMRIDDQEYATDSELVRLFDTYLASFSKFINQLSRSGDESGDENRPNPLVIDGLMRTYGKLRLANLRLRPRGGESVVRNYDLYGFVLLIRPFLELLEEMYEQIQVAIGSSSYHSLNDLIRQRGLLGSMIHERPSRGRRLPPLRRKLAASQHREDFGMPHEASDSNEDAQDRISVAVYLDTDNVELQANAIAAIERLVYVLGYGQDGETRTEAGSIFKTWWAKILKGLTSLDVQERLARVEAYAESYLGERISAINSTEAAALKEIVTAISDIPNASLRVGSILIVKYTGRDGVVLLSRPLSILEIRVLERYPEIQQDPLRVLELLGNALSMGPEDKEPYNDQDLPPGIGA